MKKIPDDEILWWNIGSCDFFGLGLSLHLWNSIIIIVLFTFEIITVKMMNKMLLE
jgi:hypothetical protein